MQFKIKPERDVFPLFPTPVACIPVANFAEINPGIERAILQRENAVRSLRNSNIGGWQSELDFTKWPEPEIAELVDSMRCAVLNMVGLASRIRQFESTIHLVAWANVNRSGDFNQVHIHPGCQWSGVYYVSPGEYDDDDVDFPGQLQIHDPRERADMVQHPGTPFGYPFRIQPRAGMMVIFPAWLSHSVNVFYSKTTRISVSFNAELQSFKESP
jgi:uncharacterized protein (TIGR02466 family)